MDIVTKDDIKSDYIRRIIKYILDNVYFSNLEYRKELVDLISEDNEIYTEPIIDNDKIILNFSGHYLKFLKKYEKGKNKNIDDVDQYIMSKILSDAIEVFVKEHDEEIINHLIDNFCNSYPPDARSAMVYFFQFSLYENMYSFQVLGNVLIISI